MAAQILDGKAYAKHLMAYYQQIIQQQSIQKEFKPGLAVILVGNHRASQTYVQRKRKCCAQLGIQSFSYDLAESTTTEELLALIQQLNEQPHIHGILVQLPLPKHIDPHPIILAIDPHKDVDGFHPMNMGLLALGEPHLRPCTPMGVMALLAHYQIDVVGRHALVIGSSRIVGRPMALEFLKAKSTVTIAHSKTQHLEALIQQADIVVAAIGQPGVIPSHTLKPGVIAIDVGFTRLEDGTVVGDLDPKICYERAQWYTPVPGGVGPMTIAMLMHNTLLAAGWS